MRIFAFYLPQFHEIPENDAWWGPGFTEWVNVKNATPLFKGHRQPLHPLNDYYYDLMEPETVLWQTKLMHKYKIDGFIYYHYYFEGKLLLEKPAENLLRNQSIDQPFFFCWANHSWRRSWQGESTVLVEQTYGKEESWEKHFSYLLPFFKDKRYEKKDNKPLFMIFSPYFEEKVAMMDFFDKRCKEEGFAGIAVIDSVSNIFCDDFERYRCNFSQDTEYVFFREPGLGLSFVNRKFRIRGLIKKSMLYLRNHFHLTDYVLKYSGNAIIKETILFQMPYKNGLKGLFFEWDNTPRHKYRGYIIKPISKKSFNRFMNEIRMQDYCFINAWNEWCEGMILEPTLENGSRYLEWIKEWRDKNHV